MYHSISVTDKIAQEPVVQSIVSLTTSLRRQFIKSIRLHYQIHCYFLLEKLENPHIFSTKNNSGFVIFMSLILLNS